MSQYFPLGGQSIRVSASTSVLPMRLEITSCILGASQVSLIVKNPNANAGDTRDLASIFPSIRVFSNESVFFTSGGQSIGVFSFNVSSSNEYSGLISFRIDWSDLLAVQGTLKSLLQHHSSKASVLQCSAFFIVQLSHPYMTTGKTIAFSRRTFIGKVMSLLFNMLSRLEKAMATHSSTRTWKISWTQAPGRVRHD